MSELGVLSHRYDRSVRFSEELNEAVLTIKKLFYNIPGSENISQDQFNKSKKVIIEILTEIISNLDPDRAQMTLEKHYISRNFLKRLYNKKRGKVMYYVEDLEKVITHIKNNLSLTEDDVHILDELCTLGDIESSMLFRKLWLE